MSLENGPDYRSVVAEEPSSEEILNIDPEDTQTAQDLDRRRELKAETEAESQASELEALAILYGEDEYAQQCVNLLAGMGYSHEDIVELSENEYINEELVNARDFEMPLTELNKDKIGLKLHNKEKGVDLEKKEKVTDEQALDIKLVQDLQKEFNQEDVDKEKHIAKCIEQIQDQLNDEKRVSNEEGKDILQTTLKNLQKIQAALNLPESDNIPQEDRKRVSDIFSENVTSFDQAGINNFCKAVEADEDLSTEAKRHVLKQLGVETTIKSGAELNNTLETMAVNPKTGEKEPVFTKDNPVEIQGGLEMYVDEQGQKIVKMEGREPLIIDSVNGMEDDGARERLRFAIVQNVLDENLNGQSQLLLGGATHTSDVEMYEASRKNADKILRAILPAGSASNIENRIPNEEDTFYLQRFIDVITHEKSLGKEEYQSDMEKLGVIQGPGNISENRINEIGDILQEENYLQQLETREGDDAYERLEAEFSIETGNAWDE